MRSGAGWLKLTKLLFNGSLKFKRKYYTCYFYYFFFNKNISRLHVYLVMYELCRSYHLLNNLPLNDLRVLNNRPKIVITIHCQRM